MPMAHRVCIDDACTACLGKPLSRDAITRAKRHSRDLLVEACSKLEWHKIVEATETCPHDFVEQVLRGLSRLTLRRLAGGASCGARSCLTTPISRVVNATMNMTCCLKAWTRVVHSVLKTRWGNASPCRESRSLVIQHGSRVAKLQLRSSLVHERPACRFGVGERLGLGVE